MNNFRNVLLALAFSLVAFSAVAENCDEVVVDEAGLFGDDIGRVKEAASALENLGAVVRVRTISDFGNAGNLDRYEASIEKSCPSWQSADGGTRNNLIVLMVEVGHREKGFYYGTQWERTLGNEHLRIREDVMGPRLRDADFAGAFVGSLTEVARLIEIERTPRSVPAQANTPIIVQQPSAPSQPTDFSGLWSVMGWGLALLAIGLAAWWIARLVGDYKRRREQERAAQQRASVAKTGCANLISGSFESDLAIVAAKIGKLAKIVSVEDIAPLRDRHEAVALMFQGLIADFGRLDETPGIDPAIGGKSVAEYNNSAETYEKLLESLTEAVKESKDLDRDIESLDRVASEVPSLIDGARRSLAGAKDSVQKIASDGFRTPVADETLALALVQLTKAVDLAHERKCGAAKLAVKELETLTQRAVVEAESVRDTYDRLITQHVGLTGECGELDEKADSVHETFNLLAEFNEAMWSSIAGNGTEADNRIDTARNALAEAKKALEMDKQEFGQAESLLAGAKAKLSEAAGLLDAITEAYESIKNAEAKAPEEIELAKRDIEGARLFVSEHRDVVGGGHDKDLDDAEALLEQARSGLVEAKPNFLAVVKLALRANSAADGVYAEAQAEHQAFLRKQERARSLMEEADRSVRAADSYIRNHSSDIGSTAKNDLSDAVRSLGLARSSFDLDTIIRHASESDTNADSALSRAKREVADMEAERSRRAAEAARAARIARERSSGGYGGGSSSWGSSSRGGGSSSFGSSRRGGGSSKW